MAEALYSCPYCGGIEKEEEIKKEKKEDVRKNKKRRNHKSGIVTDAAG